jgi:hypothetical protein
MRPFIKKALKNARAIFADKLLQLLLLGTIGAALFFALILKADDSVVLGILVLGFIAALSESAHHRHNK